MTISRQKLYAFGETFGESATHLKPGGRIYGAGGGGGQAPPSTSTTSNTIDTRFNPLIDYATQTAGRVNNSGFTPYSGQRFADMTGTQQAGISMIQDRAVRGDPTVNSGANYLQNQLNGGDRSASVNPFANTGNTTASVNPYASQQNPYLDQMVQKAQGSVMGNMGALQARSGSFGNSGIAEQGAQQMGKIATDMYGQAYNTQSNLAESQASRNDAAYGRQANLTESQAGRNDAVYQQSQGNKMGAANMALQYGNQGYNDASQLMKAGGQMQDQEQQARDFDFNQFQDQQNLPYKQMSAYGGLMGSSGSTGSSTTTNSGGAKGGK